MKFTAPFIIAAFISAPALAIPVESPKTAPEQHEVILEKTSNDCATYANNKAIELVKAGFNPSYIFTTAFDNESLVVIENTRTTENILHKSRVIIHCIPIDQKFLGGRSE